MLCYLICKTQNSVTSNSKMTKCAKLHPSYKHLKGYKKAHKYFVACCLVPVLGIFSVSPINDIQWTCSLAIWWELGIKMKIFRSTSQLAVIAQQLSFQQMLELHYHLWEPCSYGNLSPKPHSLIHFPLHSQTSKFLAEGNDACYVVFFPNRYPKLFLPSVELVGQKASLLHSWRSKNERFVPPWQCSQKVAGWLSTSLMAMSWEVRSTYGFFWLQVGTVDVDHQWKSVPRH